MPLKMSEFKRKKRELRRNMWEFRRKRRKFRRSSQSTGEF
jgi:hypothetical protein